jgi:peptidoglycan glycosyltransferase
VSELPIGRPARRPVGANITAVGVAIAIAFGVLAGGAGWWQVVEAGRLTTAPDNPLVIATARTALRGQIVDRAGVVLASNERDANGEVFRVYADQAVSPVVGYASLLFGSAGLERTYAADLVGLRRDPVADLLRKFDPTPADPQDLTLALSLDLQRAALAGLGTDRGAVVMLDPRTGAVLALASSPVYDAGGIANPATSRATWAALNADPGQPLLPRATLGVQDRDGDRGPRFRRVRARHGLPGTGGRGTGRPRRVGLSDPRTRRGPDQAVRPRRCHGGVVEHLLRARCARRRW